MSDIPSPAITFEEVNRDDIQRPERCQWGWSELTIGGPMMVIPQELIPTHYDRQKARASAWMFANNRGWRFKTYTRKDGALLVERVDPKTNPARKNRTLSNRE